ncbi:MAG: hypothetical protein MUP30_13045 [Deltaproteobacteria bacterium]|nr:hypothetical protein [Deltaproteobacteria bacterium]
MRSYPKVLAVCQIVCLVAVLFLFGCAGSQLFEPDRGLNTQPEAGAVNLSVTSVALWEDYIATLQPTFDLTAEEALAKVIPKTTLLEERFLDQLALSLKAKGGLPQASTSTAEATTNQKKDASALPGLQEKDKSIAEEPMLEYTAAAALYQEVQLLSRYVEDAALKYDCQAYVIRMQVGVLPYNRNQPYDVYTTLSFFPYGIDKVGNIKDDTTKPAIVLPLLVTDNLEGMLKSRSLDTIRKLALALSYQMQGGGGEVEAQKQSDKLRSVTGTDLNSLMTVSRVTDSAIQVRLGAQRQPTAGYAMIPRTHYITCLLMVPKEFAETKDGIPQVKVVAKSVFRDVENGKALPTRKKEAEKAEIREILRQYDKNWKPSDEEISELFKYLLSNDYPAFFKKLKKIDEVKGSHVHSFGRNIWLQFIENIGRSEFTAATFDLPRPEKTEPPKNQAVLLLDDGESATTAYLRGGKGMIPSRMSAQLTLKMKDGETLPFIATSVQVGPGGKDPVLVFPSLKAWKVEDMKLEKGRLVESNIEIFDATGDRWNPPMGEKPNSSPYKTVLYRLQKSSELPPSFKLWTPLDSVIAAKDGAGQLKLFLELKKENNKPLVDAVEITLANAQVDEVKAETPGTAKLVRGKITTIGSSTLTLTMSNLVKDKKITIKAAGMKGGNPSGGPHADIVLSIVEAPK